MSFTKEKIKRMDFVNHEVFELVKVINPEVDSLEFIDRGDYEAVCICYECGSAVEFDVTGTSLAELAVAIIENIDCYE